MAKHQSLSLLESSSVRLRAIEPEDVDLMYEVENDASQWDTSDTLAPFSREALRQYAFTYDADPFRAGQLRLVIESKSDGLPAGIIDLYEISRRHRHAFTGIYILPSYRRQGLALQALDIIARYAGQTLGLRSIAAKISEANESSSRLYRAAGYRHAGTLLDWLDITGSPALLLYQLSLTQS